ncbi:MAG: hypothetical protein ACX93O_15805 [Flagellimonas sp.]
MQSVLINHDVDGTDYGNHQTFCCSRLYVNTLLFCYAHSFPAKVVYNARFLQDRKVMFHKPTIHKGLPEPRQFTDRELEQYFLKVYREILVLANSFRK